VEGRTLISAPDDKAPPPKFVPKQDVVANGGKPLPSSEDNNVVSTDHAHRHLIISGVE
jgi:hypothetical protein